MKCGETWPLECAHIMSRRFYATRWLDINALCLCAPCHRWLHDRPIDGKAWIIETIGEARYEALRLAAHNDPPMDPEAVIAALEGRV